MLKVPSMFRGDSLKRLLQGAAVGAIATMIIGFHWGGWTLASTTKQLVADAAISALVPVCAEQFLHGPAAAVAEFNKAEGYDKKEVVGKYVKKVGNVEMNYSFLSDCADEIIKESPPQKQAEQKS